MREFKTAFPFLYKDTHKEVFKPASWTTVRTFVPHPLLSKPKPEFVLERVGGVEPHSAQLGRLASHLELTREK